MPVRKTDETIGGLEVRKCRKRAFVRGVATHATRTLGLIACHLNRYLQLLSEGNRTYCSYALQPRSPYHQAARLQRLDRQDEGK